MDQMLGQLHEIEGKDKDATLSKYLLMYVQNCFWRNKKMHILDEKLCPIETWPQKLKNGIES